MKIYNVCNLSERTSEEFYSLSVAKREMKRLISEGHEIKGYITKVYSNGDWVECGEIKLSGSNKTFIANSRQTISNY